MVNDQQISNDQWEVAKNKLDKAKRSYAGNRGSGAVDQTANDSALKNLAELEAKYLQGDRSKGLYEAMTSADPGVAAAPTVKKLNKDDKDKDDEKKNLKN